MDQYNFYIKCSTATEAFDAIFNRLKLEAQQGTNETSRDGAVVGELINPMVVITDPTRGIVQSKIRKMPIRYAVGELLWYLSGSNKTGDISQYSEKWEELSDDGVHANSAYGYRIHEMFGFDQWNYVRDMLKNSPNSRQAVIHIKNADNHTTKDTPCTVSLQFLLRDNKLHLTVYMRSNDIWFGFPYDVFSFTAMQIKMAFELGVEIGTYTHVAGSLHLYERDLKTYIAEHTTEPVGS